MTCAEARAAWDEASSTALGTALGDASLEASGEAEPSPALGRHLAGCPSCAAALAERAATRSLCRRAGTLELPDGFALGLHRRLVAAPPPRPSWLDRLRQRMAARPLAFATTAAALAALLAVGATRAVVAPHGARTQVALYRVPENKVALVKIEFIAEKDIEDVAFEITLPDGLRFVNHGEALATRTFVFQGRLGAGSNPVPIAVKGPRAGRYRVIAHAIGAALDVTQEVMLEVTA